MDITILNKQFQLSRVETKQAFKNFLLNKTEQNLNIYKIAKLKRDLERDLINNNFKI
jgi:hypothetical protein